MDIQEFTTLALAEMDAVHRLAIYLAGRHEADDLVQEAYARAFRSHATYKPSDNGMRPWLFKILHNVLYTRMSDEQRRRAVLDGVRDSAPTRESSDGATSLAELDWEQVDGRLRSAIDELPLRYKSIFLLSAIEQLRYKEIAAVVDVPIGTVMSTLHRARLMLAAKLKDVAAEHRIGRPRPSAPMVDAASATERETDLAPNKERAERR